MQRLIVWKFFQKIGRVFPLCSVSLQARHSVNPGFSVPRNSREVSWCPVASVVVRPGERSSGGWELMISNRWRSFTSIFTMRWSLFITTKLFLVSCRRNQNREFKLGWSGVLFGQKMYCSYFLHLRVKGCFVALKQLFWLPHDPFVPLALLVCFSSCSLHFAWKQTKIFLTHIYSPDIIWLSSLRLIN